MKVSGDFGVLVFFCCFWAYFIVCGFVEQLGTMYVSFLFIDIMLEYAYV
jgi:hypothetical protein